MKDNIVHSKSFEFALTVIEKYKELQSKNLFIMSKQLLRSGTSIGANIEEAIRDHSRKDFFTACLLRTRKHAELVIGSNC